jgi:transcriptional regulator with XRE-family HTH domain
MNALQIFLYQERHKLKFNKTQFAQYLGLTLATIHRIEKTGNAGPNSLKKISLKFNVSIYKLLEMKDEHYKQI